MDERERIVAWLRDAVEQGYPNPSTTDKRAQCSHGKFYFEDCIACYDEFLFARLDGVLRGDHLVWKPEPTIPVAEWIDKSSVGH